MASVGDIHKEKKEDARQPMCTKHDEYKRLYCETCQELFCPGCAAQSHCDSQHRVTDAGGALPFIDSEPTDFTLLASDSNIRQLEDSLAATSRAREEFQDAVAASHQEVEDIADGLIANVRAEASRVSELIKAVQQIRLGALDERERVQTAALRNKEQSLQAAGKVLANGGDKDEASRPPAVKSEVEESKALSEIDQRLAYLRFIRGPGIGGFFLGTLRLEAKWELCCEFGEKGVGAGEFIGAHAIASLPTDRIAVADWFNKRVVICSTDGRIVNTININRNPRGVAAIGDQIAIVDTSPWVAMYNHNCDFVSKFTTVPQSKDNAGTDVDLRGIAVTKDGTLLVGDAIRNVLTEHSPNGMLIGSAPVSVRPSYLATDGSGRLTVVSGGVQEVHVLHRSTNRAPNTTVTTTTTTIRPSIDGRPVQHSNGVCCDSSGCVYIAVDSGEGTGHIHRYRSDGTFLECAVRDLCNPYGIAFTEDEQQLVVADCYSVKLYCKV